MLLRCRKIRTIVVQLEPTDLELLESGKFALKHDGIVEEFDEVIIRHGELAAPIEDIVITDEGSALNTTRKKLDESKADLSGRIVHLGVVRNLDEECLRYFRTESRVTGV